jgi:hypothetical protein
MKPFFLIVYAFCFGGILHGQASRDQRIEDSVIGWWDNNRFDKSLKPTTDPVQLSRIAQLNKLVEWMKKSYTPVGGLGTFRRENLKTSYGVRFMIWSVSYDPMWLDEKGHFKPVAEEVTSYGIHMNTVPGSYPVPFLNGSGTYYFTWPPDGYRDNSSMRDMLKDADPKIHPQVYKYITRSNEGQMVLLAPGNKLPFVQLTRGEYLDLSEAAMNKKTGAEMEKYKATVARLRSKYKATLNEPAFIRDMQPTLNNFYGDIDVFATNGTGVAHPVYKIPMEVMKKAQSDQPQWIAIWFPYENQDRGNQLFEMYRAITENINYDYLYDYFFQPGKVKGIDYKPNNEAAWMARLSAYRNKYKTSSVNNKSTTKQPANVLLNEDFNSAVIGAMPVGWYARSYGTKAVVTGIDDQKGKWLKLGYNNPVMPLNIPKPLPANFTLEFDIATDKNFSGRAGGAVNLRLSTALLAPNGDEDLPANRQSMDIKIVAGNDANLQATSNYRGVLEAEIHNTKGDNRENNKEGIYFKASLPEFTDKKALVHITVQMKDGECRILVNGRSTGTPAAFRMAYGKACVQCGVPAGTRFNTLNWRNVTEDSGDVSVYISNIKLVKD